jgi:pyruvate dehydrogenase (quinone)
MKDWRKLIEKQATASRSPMKPQVVAAELGKRLPTNAIVNCDSGTIATWWARHIPAKARPDAYSLRQPSHHGLRLALYHRGADRLSQSAMRRFRGGSPIYDANGRLRHRGTEPIDFAAFARACGGKEYTIREGAECGDILDEALRSEGPAVIEAVVDPNEPPMPPKVTAR